MTKLLYYICAKLEHMYDEIILQYRSHVKLKFQNKYFNNFYQSDNDSVLMCIDYGTTIIVKLQKIVDNGCCNISFIRCKCTIVK